MSLEFSVGESFANNDDYQIRDVDGGVSGIANPINRGNAGIVYLADFKGLPRAIKILLPLTVEEGGDEQAQLNHEILKREFGKEIRVLSTITHTGLSKIVDFGEASIGGSQYPYYVMDYVKGASFDKFATTCRPREFLRILEEVLDALSHLHAVGYYHMDVKEENVIIQAPRGSSQHAVMIDLGGAKQIKRNAVPSDIHRTVFISTEKATREERRRHLGRQVDRAYIDRWGVDLDLYAFGAMLARAIEPKENSDLRERLFQELGESGLGALDWVADRLTSGYSDEPIEKRYFQSAVQVREAISRISPEYVAPLGLPELNTVAGALSLPLPDGRIGVTPDFIKIIDHRLFQRLGRIPQLEYIDLVYRGATHTRFEHSLATFSIAKLFLNRMLEYPDFRMIVSPDHVRAALLMSLLHDVGHYPLSHMFEDFAYQNQRELATSRDPILSDSAMFERLIKPSANDRIYDAVNEALSRTATGAVDQQPLDGLLRKTFSRSYDIMVKMTENPRSEDPDSPLPFLHSMINSAIDVDKVAYLSTDSRATGVPFGRGIDVHGLVQSLVPPKGEDRKRGAIAIKESGLAAAESIVLARFWMISRVYWEETNRSIMAMHKFVIADLIKSEVFQFSDYFRHTLLIPQPNATEYLADLYDTVSNNPQSPADAGRRNPLKGLMYANRDLYQPLVSMSNGPNVEDRELYKGVLEEGAFGVLTLGELIRLHLNKEFPFLELQYGDVLVDIPRKRRDLLGTNVLVYMDRDPNHGRDLYEGENPVSALLRGLPMDFELNIKRFRVFIHPSKMDQIKSTGRQSVFADAAIRKLREKYQTIQ